MAETPDDAVSELRSRGYAVLPAPRQVTLKDGFVRLDDAWQLETENISPDDIAVSVLSNALHDDHSPSVAGDGAGSKLRLAVQPGVVMSGLTDGQDEQAYSLSIAPDCVEILANHRVGLYYGVQTLLQLLEGDGKESGIVPEGAIVDWPRYPLRFVHWDTKHHQDRVETLKRYLDWMARFKLNAVAFEIEDKFEYPSHPVIGAPGAFTTEQMQELVDYGLARHIQIIPNVQAPAHLCYVLKHEEFAHLRCDGSNYQICMDEPEARKLLFEMYDDLCAATIGVDYFHVSTDEVYYAGICEKVRKPYNPENRSLTWVDYVKAAHEHLTAKGRRMLIWAEFPLLAEHINQLPGDIIDGILGPNKDGDYLKAQAEIGMRHLAYASMQGAERLFPNNFAWKDREGKEKDGRLDDAIKATERKGIAGGQPIGSFAAAWDDSGLHNETFWLGWATMAQGGWDPGGIAVRQTVDDFMDLYYGRSVKDMRACYEDMQTAARFWEYSWDRENSKERGPAYGSSHGKRPVTRTDMTMASPALPELPDLTFKAAFREKYEKVLSQVPDQLALNDRLQELLKGNLSLAERNAYNIEVFLSLAVFMRSHLEMLRGVADAEGLLEEASGKNSSDPKGARELLTHAREGIQSASDGVYDAYRQLVEVWEKSRYPKNAPVDGKIFFHVMDDVKDHFADRRADLSYHIAPFESMDLEQWLETIEKLADSYARHHNLGSE